MLGHSLLILAALGTLFIASLSTVAADSAWNGLTTPGSTTPAAFTPYYVPPGTKSYDSSSPLLHYSGRWRDSYSNSFIQKTLRSTTDSGASMTFSFTGTGIEWFGNTDPRHGIAQVFLDGNMVQEIDAWSATPRKQQRMYWNFELPQGRHTIKIVNTGKKREAARGSLIDVDALVVTMSLPPVGDDSQSHDLDVSAQPVSGYPPLFDFAAPSIPAAQWSLVQKGNTGVSAMQLAVISESHALVIDKVEHNPLTINGHPAWAALYNLKTHALTPLAVESNSFCAGGAFLSNGTLINVGGNPVVEDHTSAADFGDLDGLQAVRIFEPCDSEDVSACRLYENHSRIRMASPRWYTTVLRISDGSAMIIGGSMKGGWINNGTVNNPTIEYWPPKDIHGSNGLAIPLPFLVDTLNANLFPIAFSLPDGKVFIAANRDAMIYDWQSNTERRLPSIPNGVRVTYPMAGTALLLSLSPDDNYAPEVLICGGSTIDDSKAGYDISSQDPASAQCSRILLTEEGIAAGWQTELMPEARTMPDAVLLPTGRVIIVNGAGTGISGYGNVAGQIGASNADNPVLTPVLYDPFAPLGERFSSSGMPTTDIPRMYHSVATLTPSGNVMISGSNPNLDRSEEEYGTEYRVEWLNPPYMTGSRPAFASKVARTINFGQTVEFDVSLPGLSLADADIKVALMDLGFVTHAVHANSRLVYLASSLSDDGQTITVTGPPNGNVYPPGPGFLYVVINDVPSVGLKVMIGDGNGPVVDEGALQNLLVNTEIDQYEKARKKGTKAKIHSH
ncbi:copper radical oxidase [Laetiporus sulphureus 93-53]|uniref:Copper radical oxidase n=1 Tax=Laetiporus sulphureus 93-53 TaxID=1314785 RepID=A0A165FZE0_9APHY|nr:copper radical oxidase [Laetiporus sulphureus 93-53]KZT09616.1 copper radical oxidase [Laetiporus sulphureus 93-53]